MTSTEKAVHSEALEDRKNLLSAGQLRRSIYNVPVTVTVSIGRTRLAVSDLLEMTADSIVQLSARIDDPVDLMIDDRIIARGDLIEVEGGGLGLKITEIMHETENASTS